MKYNTDANIQKERALIQHSTKLRHIKYDTKNKVHKIQQGWV